MFVGSNKGLDRVRRLFILAECVFVGSNKVFYVNSILLDIILPTKFLVLLSYC